MTTITAEPVTDADPRPVGLPAATSTRFIAEAMAFLREPSTMFFGFAFPIVLFAIFASVFTEQFEVGGTTFTGATIYLAGMTTVALMSAGFLDNLSTITTDREDGNLRRLYSSPMPRGVYLGGRLAMVVLNTLLQVIVLLVVAIVFFDVAQPHDWLTFAWVVVLGTAAMTAIGIGASGLISSQRAAVAVANGATNVLAFLSGCYIPAQNLPDWMISVGQVFPAYWVAHGLRFTLLPDEYAAVEPGGQWDLAGTALVLSAWLVVGLLVSRFTFRWQPTQPGGKRR